MSDSLRNKVVVITGASSGIGRAIALESAGRGATVILIARSEDKLNDIAAEAKELSGADAFVFPTDMGKADEIEATFKKIVSSVKHIDYLVNCAGFGKFENFMDSDMQDATNMFQVNVLGLMYFTRLVGRVMIEEKTGQIVNFGSIAGKVPTTKSAAYSASKSAVIQFSNVLRLELKPFGVKVMTVNPGPVYTNFFNIADKSGNYVKNVQEFMLDPDDVAWQVVHYFGSNKRELNLPISLAVAAKLYNLFPALGDKISLEFASRK
ncbi:MULTISPECIES: SDR family oxidoreductase [Lactobacillus]|uniref:SDR family oxidoreductase n=1 Tax=Lactobacillus xujianguonis TaxID=2495899 RepID=A0A437SUL6_9LACO|nr:MULTISPECIES: SDR family oxidoreductase [Lactobacillus]RVU70615.1 SDR family oxidoreductase [Lactobacillus xujianguonis]RVU73849.1 SDR family oxidoreductase [Lactobacillus xujianguonis]